MSIHNRILEACNLNSTTLKHACETSGIRYGTLHSQIKNQREVPFQTIVRLAEGLKIPISFFSSEVLDNQVSSPSDEKWSVAERANAERGKCTRAGFAVNTDNILDWYHQEGGILRNWEWFEDQVDLYHRIDPTDRIMKPIQIGRRSLTAERLMIGGKRDFFHVVEKLGQKRIDRAMMAHKALEHLPYAVTDEEIDAVIKGQRVKGGYRKVTMRLTGTDGAPITAVFSKLTWLNSV